jgi:hypothetical protein
LQIVRESVSAARSSGRRGFLLVNAAHVPAWPGNAAQHAGVDADLTVSISGRALWRFGDYTSKWITSCLPGIRGGIQLRAGRYRMTPPFRRQNIAARLPGEPLLPDSRRAGTPAIEFQRSVGRLRSRCLWPYQDNPGARLVAAHQYDHAAAGGTASLHRRTGTEVPRGEKIRMTTQMPNLRA